MPKEYTSAYEELFGMCYDSIPYHVVALDLYSEGLILDNNHRMKGTGYNLYISDIFLPDGFSRLPAGDFHSDATGSPYSFLPGRDWDGTPTGMYLLYIEEGKLQSIQLLDSGSFIMRDTTNGLIDIDFTLYCTGSYGNRVTYKPHFQGELIPWQKK